MKIGRVAVLVFFMLSGFSFAGCGGSPSTDNSGAGAGATSAPSVVTGIAPTTALYITTYAPAASAYSAMPPTIQVTFSETTANTPTLGNSNYNPITNPYLWTMVCGAQTVYPSSVTFNATTGVATLTMPSASYLASGTTCTLNASSLMYDNAGNQISGTLSTSYTVTAGAPSPVLPYTPQTNVETYTTCTGANSSFNCNYALSFVETAQAGYSLAGFQLRSGSAIDQVSPIFLPNYGNTGAPQNGGIYGGNGGGPETLMCPGNSRVVGIFGHSGTTINSLGLYCQAQDGSSTTVQATTTFGSNSSGSSYSLICPTATYAVQVFGLSGPTPSTNSNFVDELQLGCQ